MPTLILSKKSMARRVPCARIRIILFQNDSILKEEV
jgi:hypothetical protein